MKAILALALAALVVASTAHSQTPIRRSPQTAQEVEKLRLFLEDEAARQRKERKAEIAAAAKVSSEAVLARLEAALAARALPYADLYAAAKAVPEKGGFAFIDREGWNPALLTNPTARRQFAAEIANVEFDERRRLLINAIVTASEAAEKARK